MQYSNHSKLFAANQPSTEQQLLVYLDFLLRKRCFLTPRSFVPRPWMQHWWSGLHAIRLMGKRLLEDDPRVKTHDSYYSQYKKVCNVFFVENVCEYPPEKVEAALGKEWTVLAVKLDPRNLGLGISRARIYMVCFKKSCVRWNAPFSLEEFIECLASRPILTARNLFWQRVPQHVPTVAQVSWWSFDAASFWLELKVK